MHTDDYKKVKARERFVLALKQTYHGFDLKVRSDKARIDLFFFNI